MAFSGAFDCFTDIHRAQYFFIPERDTSNMIEKAIKYGNAYQADIQAAQVSLFGSGANAIEIAKPKVPECEPWDDIEKLKKEKEVVGFYISGHPLDQYKFELEHFCSCSVDKVFDYKGREVSIAGIVSKVNVRQMKNGKSFVIFSLEDFNDNIELALFGEDYLKNAHFIKLGEFLYIKGKVQQRYNNAEWEFRPSSFQLLPDIRNKLCKGVSIQLNVNDINETLISKVEEIINQNAGSSELKVVLSDYQEQIQVDLFSRKYKINPSNAMMEELSKIEGLQYKIST